MSPGLLTSVLIRLFMAFKSVTLWEKKQHTAAFESFLLTSENKERKSSVQTQHSVYSSCAQIYVLISVLVCKGQSNCVHALTALRSAGDQPRVMQHYVLLQLLWQPFTAENMLLHSL